MQTLIYGLQVSALGLGIVFIALIFLILVIKAMAMLTELYASPKKPDKPVQEKTVQSVTDSAEDDCEIVAVIAAAVACMTKGTMRITTIRRIREEYVPAWSAAGRQETMNLRQL